MAMASWGLVHIDFMSPFMNKQFLILVDGHSKWLEVYPMNNIKTKSTIETLRTILLDLVYHTNWSQIMQKTFYSGEFQI